MTTACYQVAENLFLVQTQFPAAAAAPTTKVDTATNHYLVVDCSGSMAGDLPKVREQCKLKLPKLLKENDTISMIWFSGRGQSGVLLEGEKVAGLTDLQKVNAAIDRWLRPVGLTGFKEPIQELKNLVERVNKKNAGANSLIFTSDGMDNQWRREEVLQAVQQVAPVIQAATFVEYGFYADRAMLTAMAETAGGQLVFAQDFANYDIAFTDVLNKRPSSQKVARKLPKADVVGGFAFSMADGDIITYAVDSNSEIAVAESVDSVWFLSPSRVGHDAAPLAVNSSQHIASMVGAYAACYAALSLFATRMKPEVIRPLLKTTGDVAFIDSYVNCFGKQAYSDFMAATKAAAFDSTLRLTKGFDPNRIPRDDAFTVLQMLALLSEDQDNKILFDHESFVYSRIGRGRVDSNTVLTADEQAEIEDLQAKLTGTKDPKEVSRISARIMEISNKPDALKFEEDKAAAEEGYSVSNIVFNSTRPNVSVQVKKIGKVDLSSRKDRPAQVPAQIDTFIYRNYTVIKDGLVNVAVLPMSVSPATHAALTALRDKGDIPSDAFSMRGDVTLINFGKLPVINALMVKNVSAKDLFTKEYDLLRHKAAQKVFNGSLDEHFPGLVKKSDAWRQAYGEDGVAWLKEQGLSESGGFAPKVVQAESLDYYMGKELEVKFKGLSSLPKLSEARTKIASGKPNPPSKLMASAIVAVDADVKATSGEALKTALLAKKNSATEACRKAMLDIAIVKFAVVVGQSWFSEFSSLEENQLDVKMPDGETVSCTAELREVQIKI